MENPHLPCSYHNCKRTYTSAEALHKHIQDHQQNPAQSLPGKSFLCTSIGCDGSFGSMQQLMDHLRLHHKPNYFFLCESCRAKLRSYRTLLKHLQTCAKVAKSKTTKMETSGPNDSGLHSTDVNHPGFLMPLENPQKIDSNSFQMPSNTAPSVPASSGSSENPEPPMGTSAAIEPAKPYNQQCDPHSPFPPSLSPAPELEPQCSSRVSPPILVSSPPHTPPGSNAVWRKNQGQSFSSRILWEHTRGRYSCLQCGHSTPERKEMTAHIEVQHRSPGAKLLNDMDAATMSSP